MKKNDKVVTYAYKHDGSFHRVWTNNTLLCHTKDYYIVGTDENVRVIETKNHYWFTKEPALNYFSKKRWFNIIIMFKEKDIVYYCNLATPILEEMGTLKYIDYDLDVKYYVNSKKIKILDKNEFNVNKFKYKYPEWIEERVLEELKILQSWMKNEIGPFSPQFREKWYKEMIQNRSINEPRNRK